MCFDIFKFCLQIWTRKIIDEENDYKYLLNLNQDDFKKEIKQNIYPIENLKKGFLIIKKNIKDKIFIFEKYDKDDILYKNYIEPSTIKKDIFSKFVGIPTNIQKLNKYDFIFIIIKPNNDMIKCIFIKLKDNKILIIYNQKEEWIIINENIKIYKIFKFDN